MSTKSKLNWILLGGASLAAMGAMTPAMAQDDEVSDEIVVTATGRAAAIQDVPLAVTAIGGETLANSGVQDLRDVTQVAPSLQMGSGQSNSSGTIARIRGIGTGSDNPGFEAAVGIFIDGVYRSRAGAALADLPDLVRVEVLRGPQGTLFGRNTSAGAISVVTQSPEFEPGMYIESLFGIEDLEEYGMRAGVNVPVSDTFALRVDGSIREREGYITDLISGDDINTTERWSGRAQALWDISDDASLRVIVDASETDEVCCGTTPIFYGATQGAISLLTAGAGTPAIDIEGRGMTVTPGRGYGEAAEEFGISAQLDWDLGGVNLTSITSQRSWKAVRDQDVDFNLIDIAYRDGLSVGFDNFTQEIRLQGEAGNLDWLVGVFYGDETLRTTDRIRIGAQSSLFTNVVTIGGTAPVFGAPGCELYNFTAAPSLFQCAVALLPAPAQAPMLAAVNSVNGGYLLPNASGTGQQNDNWQVETQSLALFTHNEYSISPDLVLTVGARYNHETKDLTADLFANGASCSSLQQMETATSGIIGPTGLVTLLQNVGLSTPMNFACNPAVNSISNGAWADDSEENEVTGTISLAYHLNDDLMIYGGYSRGYKAGGWNVDRSGFSVTPATVAGTTCATPVGPGLRGRVCADDLEFGAEFTDAYELGLKSTILGGTTTLNLAAFYQQIHDYQSNNFNGFNFITQNVPEVISQGAELEVSSSPMDGLNINMGVVYTDAYYDSTVVFNPLDPGPNTISSGDPLTFAAEWVVTGGVAYEMPLGGNLRALFYLDGRWNSGYRTQTLDRNPITDNDAFAIFNGRIGIGPESEHWSVELWGQNLTDEFYYVGAFDAPLQDTTMIFPNAPQTWGVTVRARY
ncbi:MAG: TonB-dependent receptor [Hyphomonadaceae bacterium]